MKSKIFIIVMAFAAILSASAAPNERPVYGNLVKKELKITKKFNTVIVSDGLKVVYTVGAKSAGTTINYEVYQDLAEYISIEVENDAHIISLQPKDAIKDIVKQFKTIYVAGPSIGGITVSSGASFNGSGRLTHQALRVEASSAASFAWNGSVHSVKNYRLVVSSGARVEFDKINNPSANIRINASSGGSCNINDIVGKYIEAGASSGAAICLSGEVGDADYEASSGANVNARTLYAKDVNATASSGAIIKCAGKNLLTHKSSSGGSIDFRKQ